MYLKRLELSGFKSFAKKTVIPLDGRITAIVGPNGSGKSNVAEAIRFVLGEQSMKSLRGKSGSDLIFKGPGGSVGRAWAAIVFDNTKKIFRSIGGEGGPGINLDFEEVIISREVYGDGENRYLVNGSAVRLKDIMELLAPLNIGSSGHHIISQGEADKILNASIRERREMVEDALGLRVYQWKIKESERKLERTEANIKEAESIRRELAPHIGYLKKQVEKVEKVREMREELTALYAEYFRDEAAYLDRERHEVDELGSVRRELHDLDKTIAALKSELSLSAERENEDRVVRESEEGLRKARARLDELARRLGRLEGMIELEEERLATVEGKGEALTHVERSRLTEFVGDLRKHIDRAITESDLSALRALLAGMRTLLERFVKEGGESAREDGERKLLELKREHAELLSEKSRVALEEERFAAAKENAARAIARAQEDIHGKEKEFFELSTKRSELVGTESLLNMREEKLRAEEEDFRREVAEAVVLAGEAAAAYPSHAGSAIASRETQEERRRKIERIKIRLEDSGIGSVDETMKEFEEIRARDEFLEHELADLRGSKDALLELMANLRERLDTEFKEGIHKINAEFKNFFLLMFGGGSASITVVKREKRVRRDLSADEAGEDGELSEEEAEFEEGVDVAVSIPQKKARDLAMLSGGERALTSIALLFAISQVKPPPFLVLDETDAALDEANSRKYGDMLEKLSKVSDLVVITHNRETMSRASVLYGVTIGSDGASRLLSIKFTEAESFAK